MNLGSAGAMRLASDCAQLEFALSLLLGPTGFSSAGNESMDDKLTKIKNKEFSVLCIF